MKGSGALVSSLKYGGGFIDLVAIWKKLEASVLIAFLVLPVLTSVYLPVVTQLVSFQE